VANDARYLLQRIGLAVFAVLAMSDASRQDQRLSATTHRHQDPLANGFRLSIMRMPCERAGHLQTSTGRFKTPSHLALVRNQQTAT
jgi:hypothetical protein